MQSNFRAHCLTQYRPRAWSILQPRGPPSAPYRHAISHILTSFSPPSTFRILTQISGRGTSPHRKLLTSLLLVSSERAVLHRRGFPLLLCSSLRNTVQGTTWRSAQNLGSSPPSRLQSEIASTYRGRRAPAIFPLSFRFVPSDDDALRPFQPQAASSQPFELVSDRDERTHSPTT